MYYQEDQNDQDGLYNQQTGTRQYIQGTYGDGGQNVTTTRTTNYVQGGGQGGQYLAQGGGQSGRRVITTNYVQGDGQGGAQYTSQGGGQSGRQVTTTRTTNYIQGGGGGQSGGQYVNQSGGQYSSQGGGQSGRKVTTTKTTNIIQSGGGGGGAQLIQQSQGGGQSGRKVTTTTTTNYVQGGGGGGAQLIQQSQGGGQSGRKVTTTTTTNIIQGGGGGGAQGGQAFEFNKKAQNNQYNQNQGYQDYSYSEAQTSGYGYDDDDDGYGYGNYDDDDDMFGDYSPDRQEEVGNHWMCGLIAAGLACLLALIAAVIAWIMFDHWKNLWMLAFAIGATLGTLIFAYAAYWCFNNNKKRSTDAEYHPSAISELLVWVLAILAMIFFLVAGVAMFVYMPFHESYMWEKQAEPEIWKKKWGKEYGKEWKEEKDHLKVLGAFSLIIGALMIPLAFNTYSMSIKKYNLNVTMFLLAALAALCFAFGVVVHYQDINWWTDQYSNPSFHTPYKPILLALFILAIIAIVLAFLNLLLSFMRNKFFSYVFLFLILLACILGAIFLAEYGKSLRKNQSKGMWNDGREILRQTHKDKTSKFCDYTKYVGNNDACLQEDFTTSWESNEYASTQGLNQKCYGNAARFMHWKYFVMFLLAAFLVMFLAVLAIMNLNLMRDPEAEKSNVAYLGIAGLMGLIALGLGLYLIFGYKSPDHQTYPNSSSKLNGNFQPVKKITSQTAVNAATQCNLYKNLKPFELNGNPDAYGRLAVLIQNGRLEGVNSADLGPDQRLNFFNDSNSNNKFYMFKGTQEELNNTLKKSQLCINKTGFDSDAFFKYEEVDSALLNGKALKSNENPNSPYLSSNGTEFDGSSVTHANQCASNCSVAADLSSNNKSLFTIPVVVQNKNGSAGIYTLPEVGLRAQVLDENHNLLGYAMITQKSQIAFEAHTYPSLSYPLLVKTTDENGYYTSNITKVVIPAKEQIDSNQSSTLLPRVVLLTKDGKGCAGDFNGYQQCISDGKNNLQNGELVVNTFDALTGEEIDEDLTLSKYHADKRFGVLNMSTTNGSSTNGGLPYGAYNISTNSNKYEDVFYKVNLQKPKEIVNLFLIPVDADRNRITNVSDVSNSQFDMGLMMQNKAGDTCTVGTANKNCPGAHLAADYVKNDQRVQVIDVDNYTKANYMIFYAPSKKLRTNCPLHPQGNIVERTISGSSSGNFSGWNLGLFSNFFEMFKPMNLYESGLTQSSNTNTYSTYNPYNFKNGFNNDNIVPYIGKTPNYPAILGLIGNNYTNDQDRYGMVDSLTNNDDERSRISLSGQNIYNNKPHTSQTNWLGSLGNAFGGGSWSPTQNTPVYWNENSSSNSGQELFNTGDYNMNYWAGSGQSERPDRDQVFGIGDDNLAWYCGLFVSCEGDAQPIEGVISAEEGRDDTTVVQPDEPVQNDDVVINNNDNVQVDEPEVTQDTIVTEEEPEETEDTIVTEEEPDSTEDTTINENIYIPPIIPNFSDDQIYTEDDGLDTPQDEIIEHDDPNPIQDEPVQEPEVEFEDNDFLPEPLPDTAQELTPVSDNEYPSPSDADQVPEVRDDFNNDINEEPTPVENEEANPIISDEPTEVDEDVTIIDDEPEEELAPVVEEEEPAPVVEEEEPAPVVEEEPAPVVEEEEPAPVVEEEEPTPVVEEEPAPVVEEEEPAPVVEEEEPTPVEEDVTEEEPAPIVEEEPAPVVEEEPEVLEEDVTEEEPVEDEATPVVDDIIEEQPTPVEEENTEEVVEEELAPVVEDTTEVVVEDEAVEDEPVPDVVPPVVVPPVVEEEDETIYQYLTELDDDIEENEGLPYEDGPQTVVTDGESVEDEPVDNTNIPINEPTEEPLVEPIESSETHEEPSDNNVENNETNNTTENTSTVDVTSENPSDVNNVSGNNTNNVPANVPTNIPIVNEQSDEPTANEEESPVDPAVNESTNESSINEKESPVDPPVNNEPPVENEPATDEPPVDPPVDEEPCLLYTSPSPRD